MNGVLKEQRKHAGLQSIRNTDKRKEKSRRGVTDGKNFTFMIRQLRKVLAFTLMGGDGD